MNNSLFAHLNLSDNNMLWYTKVDVSFFLESIRICLLLQSLPRCNQSQTPAQKESLKKLFCMIDCNNEDSISKFEIQQFFEKIMIKICPAEDIDEMGKYKAESMTKLTNHIFDHIHLNKDDKLNLEDVFEGLKYQVGIQLCQLTHVSKFIKFQDQPCAHPDGQQSNSEESKEVPGKESSILSLLALNTPCTPAFTTPISYYLVCISSYFSWSTTTLQIHR